MLIGNNAQGKTNLLEAIYILATLRSFRGATNSALVRYGQKGYFIGATILQTTNHNVKLYWSKDAKKLILDDQPVRKIADYFGIFKAVIFCSEDTELVKGASRYRRRYLDYLLAQTIPQYLQLLQSYTQTVKSRNAILKQTVVDIALLESFTQQLIKYGEYITELRQKIIKDITPIIQDCYKKISSGVDQITIEYKPSIKTDFEAELQRLRDKELQMRVTLAGPHRDDIALYINGNPADIYASEGQKRTLAIALKMAQAEYLTLKSGVFPALLIDDIMGELDQNRKAGFIPLLERAEHYRSQVFITCTEWTLAKVLSSNIHKWIVINGTLKTDSQKI